MVVLGARSLWEAIALHGDPSWSVRHAATPAEVSAEAPCSAVRARGEVGQPSGEESVNSCLDSGVEVLI